MESGEQGSPRAERILDVTRELLLTRGSRAVKLADVAKLSGLRKDVIYRYWDTKEELVVALFLREYIAGLDEFMASLEAQPNRIVPHRLFPLMQGIIRKHPLIVATQTEDYELVGMVHRHPAMQQVRENGNRDKVIAQLLPVLRQHGILRTDLGIDTQICAATAILNGFFATAPAWRSSTMPANTIDTDLVLGEVCRLVLEEDGVAAPDALASACATALEKVRKIRQEIADIARANGKRGLTSG